ncbi:helix-turn-helix domain-containing protein [Aestuariivirga sp.]|uniref:helix-turn-helix domain-containing protein n=1 Tax=Aestuariivirga sp. TaxID=2650926 RepID=UPI0025C41BDA|nr:helix-turn-helix domain-containing protein [Aestuariivirga sp.]MCA3554779.1 helix-turn-helix domain-containing protein [Aestuariivirga sp.]
MPKLTRRQAGYRDESVPAHPELNRGHPVVVFGDHRFCAGSTQEVRPMPRPHMHSQVELNFVLGGAMTYWFDGRVMELTAGRLALFWGMIPHQVTDCSADARFVVLYVPMASFLELPALSELRSAIFRGAVVEALDVKSYDRDIFQQWRSDLLPGDPQLEQIVRIELSARIQRLEREGWRDLRELAHRNPQAGHLGHDHDRAVKVEKMAQFIGERALEDISADDVARAVGLHPNYAMSLFKRGVGLTIKQAITRHRLDMAQSMLIATGLSVATIAFDCGFNSLSSFYTAFAQRFRQSPAAFREAYERITRPA